VLLFVSEAYFSSSSGGAVTSLCLVRVLCCVAIIDVFDDCGCIAFGVSKEVGLGSRSRWLLVVLS